MLDSLTWGSPSWVLPALAIVAVATTLVVWSYRGTRATPGVRVFAGLLKSLGLLLLAFCLLEPLINDRRVRPGANLFVVLADNSASLHVRDEGVTDTRGERLQKVLEKDTPWSRRESRCGHATLRRTAARGGSRPLGRHLDRRALRARP